MAHARNNTCRRLCIAASLVCLLFGCQAAELTQFLEVDFPDTITIERQLWKKKTWGQEQDKRVATYFSRREYLADNPAFSGQRVCYADARGYERCYWVTPGENSNQWLFIEFKGARAVGFLEGEGEPFENLQPREAG